MRVLAFSVTVLTTLSGNPSDEPGAPAERTIEKYLALYDQLPLEERESYKSLRWPGTMLDDALPWDASPHVLELLTADLPERPSLGEARWFYRVSLAALTVPFAKRWEIAQSIALADTAGDLANFTKEVEALLVQEVRNAKAS